MFRLWEPISPGRMHLRNKLHYTSFFAHTVLKCTIAIVRFHIPGSIPAYRRYSVIILYVSHNNVYLLNNLDLLVRHNRLHRPIIEYSAKR